MRKLLGCCLLLLCSGCQIFNSGPRMMATIAEGAVATGTVLASKMEPTTMMAGSNGRVQNPEFVVSGFVASGVVYQINARLIGAELEYNIEASGVGGETDKEMLTAIQAVWGNSLLSETKRRERVLEIIAEHLPKPAPPPGDG